MTAFAYTMKRVPKKWGNLIPKKQRPAIAQSLSEIEQQFADRNSAIKTAYTTGT